MKRTIGIFISLLLVCLLAACGQPAPSPTGDLSPTPQDDPTSVPPAETSSAGEPNVSDAPVSTSAGKFRTDITTLATIQESYQDDGVWTIHVIMGQKDGQWLDTVDFDYGDPPLIGSEYLETHYSTDGAEDEPFIDSELLHKDMVFSVYDGPDYLGKGRITDTPMLLTYYSEMFISAAFAMEDASIQLEPEKVYHAVNGDWCPSPVDIPWDGAGLSATLDMGGGKSIDLAIETRTDEYDSERAFLQLTYNGSTEEFELGVLYEEEPLTDRITLMSADGTEPLELLVWTEYEGGWAQSLLSFEGESMATLLEQSGSY